MSSFQERVRAAPDTLKVLLAQPFPREEAPGDGCAFEQHALWMGQAPDRLAAVIGIDYADCDAGGGDLHEELETLWNDYRDSQDTALRLLADVLGAPSCCIEGHEPAGSGVPEALPDAFERHRIACWRRGDRLALLVLGASVGDGELEVCLGLVVVAAQA